MKKKKKKKKSDKGFDSEKEYIGISVDGFGHTDMTFRGLIFRQCRFSTLRLKNCKLEYCQITQSIIDEDSYLRRAVFKKVDFTGTIFRNCNLEKAQFIDCDLRYAKFENCILNCESIIEHSMPRETNLKLALCRQLYSNELGQGRTDNANNLLHMLRETEREMYWDVLQGKNDYFKSQRKGHFWQYLYKYIGCTVDKYIWGYGLNIGRIGLTMLMWVALFAICYLYSIDWGEMEQIEKIVSSILFSFNSMLMGDVQAFDLEKMNLLSNIIVLVQNFVGMIYFALLTSAVYRRVVR